MDVFTILDSFIFYFFARLGLLIIGSCMIACGVWVQFCHSHGCVCVYRRKSAALQRHQWDTLKSAACCPTGWQWLLQKSLLLPQSHGTPAHHRTDTTLHCWQTTHQPTTLQQVTYSMSSWIEKSLGVLLFWTCDMTSHGLHVIISCRWCCTL